MNISPWFMPEMTSPQKYSCLVVMISPGLRNASVVTVYKKMNVENNLAAGRILGLHVNRVLPVFTEQMLPKTLLAFQPSCGTISYKLAHTYNQKLGKSKRMHACSHTAICTYMTPSHVSIYIRDN